ncbi:MAG: Cutinase [Thermoleophilia bacterium]|nr:Cutinase [Thermoleophilia bacterium]
MLDSLRATIAEQFTSLDTPLISAAREVQAEVTASTDATDRSGSAATTVQGSLARGPRPDAATVRSAKLEEPGTPDLAKARADADRTLASIDFSKPNIALWVPATGSHAIPADWRAAVAKESPAGGTSVALVDYPASPDFNDSVSTGMETLKLVLAGIAERGAGNRVTLAGHSQGAWVIGDTIATPEVGRVVDKAALFGHPAPARVDWSGGTDPNVRQVDAPNDPFTWDVVGGKQALQAIDDLGDAKEGSKQLDLGGAWDRIKTISATALKNPALAAFLIGTKTESAAWAGDRNPHHYEANYASAAQFLKA